MIYTVTFNPTLDYALYLEHINPGRVNRADRDTLNPGGKGINVSVVLSRLGIENRALGFVAGFTGTAFLEMLDKVGCDAQFIRLPQGKTRINLILKDEYETEINTAGPDIPAHSLYGLMDMLGALGKGDTLVLAGSIPPSLPSDIYEDILGRLAPKGVEFVVDATGDLLRNVLVHRPFLIKPNIHELGALFGTQLETPEQAAEYAKKLQEQGARNVLVSMGGDGAVLLDETGYIISAKPPKGKVVGAVGSGDSMVAGFLAGWQKTGSYEKAFRLGVAAGSGTAFSEWLAEKETILGLLDDPSDYKLG